MAAEVFFEGAAEIATLTNTFSVDGTPTDPTTVTLTVTTPAQVSTTYTYSLGEITRTGTGVFEKDVPSSENGTWSYVWTGTSTASDIQAGTWDVLPTTLGHLYATVEALKSRLGITASDTVDDFELHGACFAASRWVEQCCQRTFYRTATGTARTLATADPYCLRLPEFNDLVSVSALATDGTGDGTFETAWTAADYQLWPANPAGPETRPYTQIRAVGSYTFPTLYSATTRQDRVQVTGVWGWPSVPAAVQQAAAIKAAELFKLKDAPFGVAGLDEYGVVRIRDNMPAKSLLMPYMRHPVLVA